MCVRRVLTVRGKPLQVSQRSGVDGAVIALLLHSVPEFGAFPGPFVIRVTHARYLFS